MVRCRGDRQYPGDCIDINNRKYQTMESYMRAAPSPGVEVAYFLFGRSTFVGVEAHYQYLQPRQNISRLLEYLGININNTQQAEEVYRSSAEFRFMRTVSGSSDDGLSHNWPEHALVAIGYVCCSVSQWMYVTQT
jgi:hypothetical protein